MKTQVHTRYSYLAIDSTTFDSEKECAAYEARLPEHLKWCLQQKYSAEQLREVATFELGYTSEWTTEEYESPAFLKAGGYYTEYHSSDTILEIVTGELSDVVTYAFKTRWSKHYNKFIRKIKITDLTS